MFEDDYLDTAYEDRTCIEPTDDYDGQPDEQQENEDFAHDGDFDNMYADGDGFYTNDYPEE